MSGFITYISGERMAFATFGLGLVIFILFTKINFIFFINNINVFLIFISNNFHPAHNFKILNSAPIHNGLQLEKKLSVRIPRNKLYNSY